MGFRWQSKRVCTFGRSLFFAFFFALGGCDASPVEVPELRILPLPDAGPNTLSDGGNRDAVDGGAFVPTGERLAQGERCGLARDRFPLLFEGQPLAENVLHRIALTSPTGDDPDVLIYRASAPTHAEYVARAFGDDVIWLEGLANDTWIAEVTSPFGDCESYELSVSVPPLDDDPRDFIRFTGSVSYEDRVFDEEGFTGANENLSARGVQVDLVDEEQEIIASTTTNAQGEFDFSVFVHANLQVRLRARAILEAFSQWSRVRDRGNPSAIYALESDLFAANSAPIFTPLAEATEAGGAFNILDATYAGFEFIHAHSVLLSPRLTYSWQRGLPFNCGSCYGNNTISLGGQFEDQDEFDDDIVLHEFAHYFAEYYAPDDSPGGSHRDNRVEPRLAWGEGVAYFFSALVRQDPSVVDNYIDDVRFTDIEKIEVNGISVGDFFGSSDDTLEGDLREEIISGLLWDAFDDDNTEAHDELFLGEDSIMRILLQPLDANASDLGVRGIDLADWLLGAYCFAPDSAAASEALVVERALPWPNLSPEDCAQKTMRNQPKVTLGPTLEVEAQSRPLHLQIELGGQKNAFVEVGEVNRRGEFKSVHSLFCEAKCLLPVSAQEPSFVRVHLAGNLIWRTYIPKSAESAFAGGVVVNDPKTSRQKETRHRKWAASPR